MGIHNRTSKIIDNFLVAGVYGGVFALSLAAPNSLSALEKPLIKFIDGRDKRLETKRVGRYLKQQKLITVEPSQEGGFLITVSKKGKNRATKAYFESLEIDKGAWDQKWRLVMFDIPEAYKPTRDYISHHLKRIGFMQLQKSVFVFPYPIDNFAAILSTVFPEVSKFVTHMTVSETPIHNDLVRKFSSILN